MGFLKIDGAYGEGGGQIVRTAITLSCITKKPIVIENIRKNRKAPGLKAQHVTAVRILQKICNAEVRGAAPGSTELCFAPGDAQDCRLEEDVGTAGSISLILQCAIPAAAISKKRLELRIIGGTDVPWSPTFDYLLNVAGEAFGRMGLKFAVRLNRRGYYPKGGGEAVLDVGPSEVSPVRLTGRKTDLAEVKCSYSKIPEKIIRDGVGEVVGKLRERNYAVRTQVREECALDAGASLLVHTCDGGSVAGADALFGGKTGRFGVELDRITENRLGVDENLADMVVLPASVARGMSVFCVPRITRHLETNLFVASKISGCRYGVGRVGGGFEVRVEGASDPGVQQRGKE